MVNRILIGVICAAIVAACDSVPTAPTPLPASTRPPGPAPTPTPFFEPFVDLKVGETVTRHVTGGSPECDKVPGFQCQYFRFTPPASGVVDITLTYSFVFQPLDMSVRDELGRAWWADLLPQRGNLSVPVVAGTVYEITIWYVTEDMDYVLNATLR